MGNSKATLAKLNTSQDSADQELSVLGVNPQQSAFGDVKPERGQGRYKGEKKNGLMHGKGVLIIDKIHRYEGQFENNIFMTGRYIYKSRDGLESNELNLNYVDGIIIDGSHLTQSGQKKILYKGQFNNSKKFHGQGQTTDQNDTVHTGSYVNGIQHGQCIVKWTSGSLYEGEMTHGQITGRGTYFYKPKNKTYIGQFTNGLLNGIGEIQYAESSIYIGEIHNDKKHGIGRHKQYGMEWSGTWDNNILMKGHATDSMSSSALCHFIDGKTLYTNAELTFDSGRYQGSATVSKIDKKTYKLIASGLGVFKHEDGNQWEGLWRDNKFQGGQGKIIVDRVCKKVYEGQINSELKANGFGKLSWKCNNYLGESSSNQSLQEVNVNESSCEGMWTDGQFLGGRGHLILDSVSEKFYEGQINSQLKPDGFGKLNFCLGSYYEGYFVSGQSTGAGKLVYVNGSTYEGQFLGGQLNGYAKQTYPNGDVYKGEWRNDEKWGEGRMIYADGRSEVGQWQKDKLIVYNLN